MANLESEIKKLGLSDKEAKVYLAALELGQAPAAEIASHSGINRATTYVILEELRQRGLISSFEKSKKTIFAVEPPERLSNLFEIEKKRLGDNFSDLKKILPDLNKLYEIRGERPKTRFFEGRGGVASIREDILKTKTDYFYEFLPLDESYRFFPLTKADHREKMAKKLAHVIQRTIYSTKKGKIFPKKSGKSEYKFMGKQEFTTEIVIYGNKAALVVHKAKIFGVIIDDSAISDTLKLIFNMIWGSLK